MTFGSLGMEVEKRGSGGKDKKEEDGDRSLSRRRNEKRRSLLSFQIDKKTRRKRGEGTPPPSWKRAGSEIRPEFLTTYFLLSEQFETDALKSL